MKKIEETDTQKKETTTKKDAPKKETEKKTTTTKKATPKKKESQKVDAELLEDLKQAHPSLDKVWVDFYGGVFTSKVKDAIEYKLK